jgi:hypothetical protein
MAGEFEIGDQTYDNVALVNFAPYTCVDIDASNSGAITTAVLQATTATEVLGVCYDQSKLTPAGAVAPNSAVAVRTFGIARVKAHAAITVGAYVAVAFTDGTVGPATHTAGGTAPAPILGRALVSASGIGDNLLVLLMIGARY